MKIKVEPFLIKKGNRIAKAAIEFEKGDSILAGFHLVGFTICDDAEKGLFVLFPASMTNYSRNKNDSESSKPFFFLRPSTDSQLDDLQDQILDVYDSMMGKFNSPRVKGHEEKV
jgi:hypothetical protein